MFRRILHAASDLISRQDPRAQRATLRARWVQGGAGALLLALGLGGCAQQPQQIAAAGHPKEYFPSSVYGPASRRVIADGQPVPRGGGQYLVGRPYTIAGQTYYPSERRVTQIGLASWYGDAFHGRLTANGEIYDRDSFTAAHPTMPLPSYARVTNLRNNTSMIVRVNDRGPYHSNRIMDVSRRVAEALDIRRYGTAKVKVEYVARASLAGSDDAKLASTLRTDGPARADGVEEHLMVAEAAPRARVASLGAFAPSSYPAPVRQAAVVEQERPEALRAFRAPAPYRDMARVQAQPAENDWQDPRGDGARHAAPMRHDEEDDDVRETGSLQHRRRSIVSKAAIRPVAVAAIVPAAAHGRTQAATRSDRHQPDSRAQRLAQREPIPAARPFRGPQRAAAPVPALRHASTAAAVLPPSRPIHLAAVPHGRDRDPGLRKSRFHDD